MFHFAPTATSPLLSVCRRTEVPGDQHRVCGRQFTQPYQMQFVRLEVLTRSATSLRKMRGTPATVFANTVVASRNLLDGIVHRYDVPKVVLVRF